MAGEATRQGITQSFWDGGNPSIAHIEQALFEALGRIAIYIHIHNPPAPCGHHGVLEHWDELS